MGWFTADNATNNDTALKALGKEIDPLKLRWDPIERRVRYAHLLLNIGIKSGIKLFCPGAWSTPFI